MMTTCEFILLETLLDVIEHKDPVYKSYYKDATGLRLQRKHERALEGWATYRPKDWLGRALTPFDRKDFSQSLKELERQALVETDRDASNRPNWLRLSPEGEAQARSIAEREQVPIKEPKVKKKIDYVEMLKELAARYAKFIDNVTKARNNPEPDPTMNERAIKERDARFEETKERLKIINDGFSKGMTEDKARQLFVEYMGRKSR